MVSRISMILTVLFTFLFFSSLTEASLSVTVKNETGYDLSEVKYVQEIGSTKSQVGFAQQLSKGSSHTFSFANSGVYRIYAALIMGGKKVYAKGNTNSLKDGGSYSLTLMKVETSSSGSGLNFIDQREFDAIKAETSVAATPLAMHAKIWDYKTLCSIPIQPNQAKKEVFGPGASVSATKCSALAEKLGHPVAVYLLFKNSGRTLNEIHFKGLKSITLQSGNKTISALAIKHQTADTPDDYFISNITGDWGLQIASGKLVELILLFPDAKRGDQLSISGLGTVKIE